MTQSVYDAAGGSAAILDLASAWHARCLGDPIVSHAFSHGFRADHCERLAAYWSEALGGPPDYSASMGDESSVIRMHSGNGAHVEMDEAAHACFVLALDDAHIPNDPTLRTSLSDYFRWSTATMSSHPDSVDDVVAGPPVAKWSWDGPV